MNFYSVNYTWGETTIWNFSFSSINSRKRLTSRVFWTVNWKCCNLYDDLTMWFWQQEGNNIVGSWEMCSKTNQRDNKKRSPLAQTFPRYISPLPASQAITLNLKRRKTETAVGPTATDQGRERGEREMESERLARRERIVLARRWPSWPLTQ